LRNVSAFRSKQLQRYGGNFAKETVLLYNPRGGLRINNRKLTDNDLELIETLKANKGSISMREISEILEEFGDVQGQGGIAMSTISRAIKSRLLSGKKYSRKKITHVALQRFTFTNVLYTQLFVNYLSSKDARKIKFFDEAGIKSPDAGIRLYGHAPVGERCVEVERKLENPNTTLNLLVSLNGVEYYNMLDGATDTVQFLNFFEEAANAVNFETTRPALEVGDIVVMDNLAVHHYEGGELLEEYLADMVIELLFTPVYSPDLNPVELCFNKIKTQLNYNFQKVFKTNLKLATVLALETITVEDMSHFYNLTSYLFEL
jgi:transposase